jgi:nitrogen fixation protein FixH
MNLLITIFGGMLLTVLLYAGARTLKLSNFWAAVLASGLPSFAYVAYAVAVWPGLDVVTLHVITYPTVAILLFQLYGEKAGRQQAGHWAPKIMVGFFVIITVIFGGFVHIASQGLPPALASLILPGVKGKNIHTGFAGVVAHGEDAAKGIGHHLGMESKLARLGWRLEVEGLDGLSPDRKETVRVKVTGPDGRGVENVAVKLLLGRPGQASGQTFDLAGEGDGRYRVSAALPAAGAWLATLRMESGSERIVLERAVGGE